MPHAVRVPAVRALAVLAVAASLAAPTAASSGAAILTDEDTALSAGTAPQKGSTLVDPAGAPPAQVPSTLPLGSVGTAGTMTGSLPAFSGGGSAMAFASGATQTIPGGQFDYSTFTVAGGTSLTYSSPVVIRTSGNVSIQGSLLGSDVTILCGGDFAGMTTSAGQIYASGALQIDAAGSLTVGDGVGVRLIRGATVTLRGRAGTTAVDLRGPQITATGAVTIQSATGVHLGDLATQLTSFGPLTIQAFGGDAAIGSVYANGFSSAIVEASGSVALSDAAYLTPAGPASLLAVSGSIGLAGASRVETTADGNVEARAGTSVTLANGCALRSGAAGDVTIAATGGDATLGQEGSAEPVYLGTGTGMYTIGAAGNVRLNGSAILDVQEGGFIVRAFDGDFSAPDACSVNVGGEIDVRASHDVRVVSASPVAGSVVMSAGHDLDLGSGSLYAQSGPLFAIAAGRIAYAGPGIEAAGDLDLVSLSGPVDLRSARLRTLNGGVQDSESSGHVNVDSYGGSPYAVDVRGASLISGSHPVRSGDVRVRCVVAASVVTAYFLPQSVRAKVRTDDAAKSTLRLKGTLDTGPSAATLAGAARLTLGAKSIDLTLAADAKGRITGAAAGAKLTIVPAKNGSSRAKFTFAHTGDLAGVVDGSGSNEVAMSLEAGGVTATGRVALAAGRYTLGRTRGALVAPNLFLYKAKAVAGAGAADSLSLAAGLASGAGPLPTSAPDLSVRVGPTYQVTVPGSAFAQTTPGVFVAKKPLAGVKSASIDFTREVVSIAVAAVELGDFGAAAFAPVDVTVSLGGAARTVRVRFAHKGTKLTY